MHDKKYGLILPKSKTSLNSSSITLSNKPIPSSIFETNDDEDSPNQGKREEKGFNGNTKRLPDDRSINALPRQKYHQKDAEQLKQISIAPLYAQPSHFRMKQIDEEKQRALKEDPTIFDYDAAFESFHAKDKNKKKLATDNISEPKQPKYISSLLKKAEERRLENEFMLERKIQKDREAEGEQFQNKEKFVTSAYKKKLQELKKWEEDQIKKDRGDGDIRKDTGMIDFYANLLNDRFDKNVGEEDLGKAIPSHMPAKMSQSEASVAKSPMMVKTPVVSVERDMANDSLEQEEKLIISPMKNRLSPSPETDLLPIDAHAKTSAAAAPLSSATLADYKERYLARRNKP